MSKKTLSYTAAFIGSIIGGYIPVIWGGSLFSYTSLLLGGVGSIIGIIIVYKYL